MAPTLTYRKSVGCSWSPERSEGFSSAIPDAAVCSSPYSYSLRARPFLRTCLFGSEAEARPRAGSLVKHFEADQERMAVLESAAPVELALQAANVRQWER